MSSPMNIKNESFIYTCLVVGGLFFAIYLLFTVTCSKKDNFVGDLFVNDKPINTIYNKYDQVYRNNEPAFTNAFNVVSDERNVSGTGQEQGTIDGLAFYNQFTNQPMRIDKSLIYQDLVVDGYNKSMLC
jgi:hypothetical protein